MELSTQQFNFNSIVDYNLIFQQLELDDFKFKEFQSFIIFLIYSNLKIKPNKNQFNILKKKLINFSKKNEKCKEKCKILELYLIKEYGIDYFESIYTQDGSNRNEFEILILEFLTLLNGYPKLKTLIDSYNIGRNYTYHEYYINIYCLFSNNLNNLTIETCKKIIKLLFLKFDELNFQFINLKNEYGNGTPPGNQEEQQVSIKPIERIIANILLLLKTLILFFENEIIKEFIYNEYSGKLIKMVDILSESCLIDGFTFIDVIHFRFSGENNVLLKIAELFKNQINNDESLIYNDIIIKLFFICTTFSCKVFKNEQDYELFLNAIFKFNGIENNQYFKNQLNKSIINKSPDSSSSSSVSSVPPTTNQINEFINSFKEMELLIRKVFKYDICWCRNFKDLLNSLYQINENFEYTFYRVPLDIMEELLQQFADCGNYGFNKEIHKNSIVETFENEYYHPIKHLSMFYINEFNFLNSKSAPQDEFYLLELYSKHFNKLMYIYTTEFSIEIVLESLFSNLSSSKIKYQFIKSKLNQLLQLLNFNYIQRYIYLNYKEDCENSLIYKSKSNINTYTTTTTTSKLPEYLIKSILIYLIDSKSTSFNQKIEISLVSWKWNKWVIDIINNSINVPFKLIQYYYFDYDYPEINNSNLLVKSNLKFLALEAMEKYNNVDSYILDSIEPLDWKWYNFINQFKQIQVLDIKASLTVNDFNYFNWLPKLKKLILRITFKNANELYDQIVKLKQQKQVNVLLYPYRDIETNELNLEFGDIEGCVMDIGDFINGYYSSTVPRISNHLELRLLNWALDPLNEFFKIKRFEDSYRLDKLQSLSLIFLVSPSTINYQYLLNIINCFEKAINLKEIKFYFKSNTYYLLTQSFEILFKLISNNTSFNNISRISIDLQSIFQIDNQWNLINSFSFIQIENNLNSLEFIRIK